GLVGPDGPTHAGSFDLSYLRCIPNMLIMAPSDENECRQMLYTGFLHAGPAAVRYPRGAGPGVAVQAVMKALPIGKAEMRRHGKRVALLAFGGMLTPALEAAEQRDASVVNMRFIKPLDEALLAELAGHYELLVTLEDNAVAGGAGSAVGECLANQALSTALLHLGLPDLFLEQATRAELLADWGLDAAGIVRAIDAYYETEPQAFPVVKTIVK
ncbi:MAG: transketolase C-terminal domain-containing protein, partial [Gammaproteobacteria bacterium]